MEQDLVVLFPLILLLDEVECVAHSGDDALQRRLHITALHLQPVNLALNLLPFAGIAFLWFIGVLRDRMGAYEDRFFATVFLGSGLLFLAMLFASAAVAGGIMMVYRTTPGKLMESGTYTFGRTMVYHIVNVYADNARKYERMGEWIERIGWPRFFKLTGIEFTRYHIDDFKHAGLTYARSAQVRY